MKILKLEQIYFIGQTIAAIAVVASLIYVGIQVNQNTTATQIASAQAYAAAENEIVGLINVSPNLADVLHQGANGLSELKGGDLIRFMAFNDSVFISFQSFHLQWKTGALNEILYETYKHAIIDLLQQKGQQDWWALRRHWFSPEFQDYVEQAMATGLAKPMHPGSVEG